MQYVLYALHLTHEMTALCTLLATVTMEFSNIMLPSCQSISAYLGQLPYGKLSLRLDLIKLASLR